jgi:PD-(D/E)XK endonuclease
MPKPRRALRGRTPASEESRARQASQKGSAKPKEGEQGELAFLSKASSLGFAHMLNGLYLAGMHHRANRKAHAYTASEIDFVAVYIQPEKTWYILPVREVTEHRQLLFRPKGYHRRDPYAHYREAWHLLR